MEKPLSRLSKLAVASVTLAWHALRDLRELDVTVRLLNCCKVQEKVKLVNVDVETDSAGLSGKPSMIERTFSCGNEVKFPRT